MHIATYDALQKLRDRNKKRNITAAMLLWTRDTSTQHGKEKENYKDKK